LGAGKAWEEKSESRPQLQVQDPIRIFATEIERRLQVRKWRENNSEGISVALCGNRRFGETGTGVPATVLVLSSMVLLISHLEYISESSNNRSEKVKFRWE